MVYRQFDSVKAANRVIKKIARKNRILGLSLDSHGNSLSMELNSKQKIDLLNVGALEKSFRYLDPNCVIILKSCSAGKLTQNTCIAKMISQIARGRLVIAPTDEVESTGSSIWIDNGEIKASFRTEHKSGGEDLISIFKDAAYAFSFVFSTGYIGKTCTAEFRHPT